MTPHPPRTKKRAATRANSHTRATAVRSSHRSPASSHMPSKASHASPSSLPPSSHHHHHHPSSYTYYYYHHHHHHYHLSSPPTHQSYILPCRVIVQAAQISSSIQPPISGPYPLRDPAYAQVLQCRI